MGVSEAAKRAKAKYEREKVAHKQLRFYPANAEELAQLEAQPSQNAYVMGLIRRDMSPTGGGDPIAEYLVPVMRSRAPRTTTAPAQRHRKRLDAYLARVTADRRTEHARGQ